MSAVVTIGSGGSCAIVRAARRGSGPDERSTRDHQRQHRAALDVRYRRRSGRRDSPGAASGFADTPPHGAIFCGSPSRFCCSEAAGEISTKWASIAAERQATAHDQRGDEAGLSSTGGMQNLPRPWELPATAPSAHIVRAVQRC